MSTIHPFNTMLAEHKRLMSSNTDKFIQIIAERDSVHDLDKLSDPRIYDVYEKHFPILKTIPFGTSEYRNYEEQHMKAAQDLHIENNRHHFYSHGESGREHLDIHNNVDLFDIIEAILDIKSSQEQYTGSFDKDKLMEGFKRKGFDRYVNLDVIENTLNTLHKQKGD